MQALIDAESRPATRPLRLAAYAWAVLAFNLLVVVWGAFVRATGSGAGCGSHWPSCNGQVVPRSPQLETIIEFTHRSSSGLLVLLVGGLVFLAYRNRPRRHPLRLYAALAALFIITEALLGAGLVLFGLVADNASPERAVVTAVHLLNTLFLAASLCLAAWHAGGRHGRALAPAVVAGAPAVMLLVVSGAIAALGDTLFPAGSLAQGLSQDWSPTAHFLLRLRILHPLIAAAVGSYILAVAFFYRERGSGLAQGKLSLALVVVVAAQVAAGFLNVLLLAPVWLQLVHLLLANLIWVAWVLLAAAAGEPTTERAQPTAGTAVPRATARDYLMLTKPRVISLLLFTTVAATFIAARGWPGLPLLLAVSVGGYMAAGAANAINMVIDRDIDGRMRRTSRRPTVTQVIPARQALAFALALTVGSVVILAAVTPLAAIMALAGLVWYVLVYTLLLKRRHWNNIVIGGAAGAFPPLVGWAAVTGSLSPLAWYLFALIFLWTPVHFWALALMIKDDYAAVGVPMLPVVRGERVTVAQIWLYATLTALVSLVPLLLGQDSLIYLLAIVALNALLLRGSYRLYEHPARPAAVSLYKFSMLYLALSFLAMALDRALPLVINA